MHSELEKVAVAHGDRLKIIPIERLKELKEIVRNFKIQEKLNNFQNWIVDELYQFEVPEQGFKVNSILIIAIPHPFCAKVDFYKEGKKRTFLSLVRSDFKATEGYVHGYAKENGYTVREAKNLPLKRLAVHSGLAKYGRNNITYIQGLGSNFSYVAYFSDMVCGEDTWGEVKNAKACQKCKLCVKSCPTGAILRERFLIDNQKCLSCLNEAPGRFPAWLPAKVHHTLYDCLICQRVCPMNDQQVDQVVESISFTEEETDLLLAGKRIETFSEDMKAKIRLLGMGDWYGAIPRNLRVLFEQVEENQIAGL